MTDPLQTARAEGLAAATACARVNGDTWTDKALKSLVLYAQLSAGAPFTIEQAREWLGDMVPAPKDDRAWGAVTAKAVRLNHIRPRGYAPARTSHGSRKPTYVAVLA